MSKSANVKVYCRIRPENEKEKQSGMKTCITPTSENSVKIITEAVGVDTGKDSSKNKSENFQTFTYDSVFPPETEQEKIFNIVAKPLINSALEGINGTLFCYGQTASGKTYTMEGIHNDPKIMGVIPRMMQYIFILIEKANSEIEYSVKCQYYQIYNEKIQDLLDIRKKDLSIREDKNKGIWVEDCTEIYVSSQEEMYAVFKEGSNNRTVSATNMNKGSSRSHSLFVVTIFQRNTITGSSKTGRIYFVDLAGSEKMSKTGIESGKGLKEAQNINKSLMTLGMVINSLTEGAKHIPYRDSKLTRVLQESLGGNSMTNLVITVSPNFLNQSETLSTLRFGQRAKLIKNKVVANTQQSVKELMIKLKKAEERISMLEKIIQDKGGNININDKSNTDKNYKCEECKLISGQLNYVKNELINTMTENEELIKYKEELCDDIKNKNNEIVKLNDVIRNYEFQIQGYKEENNNYFNEIKNYIELIMNQYKEMKKAIKNKDIPNIEKSYNYNYKTSCDLIDKLGLPINYDFDFGIKDNNSNNQNNNTVIIKDSNEINENKDKKNNDNSIITNSLNRSFNQPTINNISLGHHSNKGIKLLNKSFIKTTIKNNPFIPLLIKNNQSHNTTKIIEPKIQKQNDNINRTHTQTQEEDDSLSINLENSRKENELLKKKQVELEYIIKALNEKLFEKDDKFQKYKEKSLQDLAFKEKKLQNLANLIGDLEDENYRLKHMSKDNMTKAKILMMEKQITTFANEFKKKDEKNKNLENKVKQQDAQIIKLTKENKMLQNNLDFFSKNFNNLGRNNNDIFSSRNMNDFMGGDPSDRNYLRNSNSIFDGFSFYDGESVLDQSFRYQRNKMMKFIKGGTKTNQGFFSKIMDNNRQDTFKMIHDFKGQTLNNKDFQMEQLENQLKQLDKDVLNETQSEFI
jgi:kinesin family protein 5